MKDHQKNIFYNVKIDLMKNYLEKTPINELYRNFSEFMEIEEKFGVKSTFFFRTQYENGDYRDYQDDIKKIIQNGWEIGLHTDPSSINEIKKIEEEKNNLEKLTSSKILEIEYIIYQMI